MAMYRYFNKAPSWLQNPNGPILNRTCMLSEAISAANCKVLGWIYQDTGQIGKTINAAWGPYATFTADEKVVIAKTAAELVITNTLRYFQKKFADHPLKESTARTWMTKYKSELSIQVTLGRDLTIKKKYESELSVWWNCVRTWQSRSLKKSEEVIHSCWAKTWTNSCGNMWRVWGRQRPL